MLLEMQHRACQVHVDCTAVVRKFQRAVEQLQKHLSYKIETHGCALGLRNQQTRALRSALSNRQCDRRYAHGSSSSVAQYLGSLRKATVNKLKNITSSAELTRELCAGADDEDEVDHDMRRDEEISGPAAAEVPRVQVPAAVASELSSTTSRH